MSRLFLSSRPRCSCDFDGDERQVERQALTATLLVRLRQDALHHDLVAGLEPVRDADQVVALPIIALQRRACGAGATELTVADNRSVRVAHVKTPGLGKDRGIGKRKPLFGTAGK